MLSAHPGVTHNYRREHDFNLWFTITVAPTSRLGLRARRSTCSASWPASSRSARMPALRFFKIGVDLDMKGGRDPAAKKARRRAREAGAAARSLSAREIEAIRALQPTCPP